VSGQKGFRRAFGRVADWNFSQGEQIDMDFASNIEEAVREIFETMVGLDIHGLTEAGPPQSSAASLTGMIGLAGELQATLLIHLPEPVAVAVTNAFLGLDLQEVDEDVKDAVGELANMVAGGIKYRCPEQGKEIELTIPSVVWGKGYSCEATGRFECTAQTFGLETGALVVELQVRV
jgi:chemotaxis protein CheX